MVPLINNNRFRILYKVGKGKVIAHSDRNSVEAAPIAFDLIDVDPAPYPASNPTGLDAAIYATSTQYGAIYAPKSRSAAGYYYLSIRI